MADLYLRFEGLKGECTDQFHPGDAGWVSINDFSFGCGSKSDTMEVGLDDLNDLKDPNDIVGYLKKRSKLEKKAQKKKGDSGSKKTDSWGGGGGALRFETCGFKKAADRMSAELLKICHGGEVIRKVEFHAVRYGGYAKIQMPILHMIFEEVYLKRIKLNLAIAGRPSEDIEFEYDSVELNAFPVDNDTGRSMGAAERAIWRVSSLDESHD